MSFIEIILLAFSLALDAFAVSLGACAGERPPDRRGLARLAFHFGLFQFLMPVAGWLLGFGLERLISTFDHWIAFGLLTIVGGRMVRTGLDPDCENYPSDPSRGTTLLMLSVATSIDALAVGLSLGLVGISIWYPAALIGVITAAISFLGGSLGRRLGVRLGKRMGIAGGVILVLIGLRILISHLAS